MLFVTYVCIKIQRMNTPKHKLYSTAETLFIEQGMTCVAISETLGIQECTLSNWRKGMMWDEKRRQTLSTPDAIRRLLLDELERISKGEKTTIDTDGLSKVAKAIQYFEGRTALAVVISVLKEVDYYIAEIAPHKVAEITKYHQLFIARRAELDSLK